MLTSKENAQTIENTQQTNLKPSTKAMNTQPSNSSNQSSDSLLSTKSEVSTIDIEHHAFNSSPVMAENQSEAVICTEESSEDSSIKVQEQTSIPVSDAETPSSTSSQMAASSIDKYVNEVLQPSDSSTEEADQSLTDNSEPKYNPKDYGRDQMLKRILVKVFILCLLALFTMLLAPKVKANDHLSMASLSVGASYPNGLDLTVQYEHSTSYHSAWAVELGAYLRWRSCPDCDKVCSKSFWDYYRCYHLGLVYKSCVYRTRNAHGRLRLGAAVGYDHKHLIGGILLGYEQTYCLPHGLELFWTAKADIMAKAKTWVRPGVSIGVRLPL